MSLVKIYCLAHVKHFCAEAPLNRNKLIIEIKIFFSHKPWYTFCIVQKTAMRSLKRFNVNKCCLSVFQCAGPSDLFVGRYATQQPRQKIQVVASEADEAEIEPVVQPMKTHTHPHSPPPPLVPGDWVLVRYDESTFPGEVKVVGHGEVKVNVMVPSGSLFKWPAVEDSIFYRMEDVIKKLNPPTLKSARGTFEFQEKW